MSDHQPADTATMLTLQLHAQNQEQMQVIGKELAQVRQFSNDNNCVLARIDENTKVIPALLERVDSLEQSRDRAHGVLWAIGALWALIEAALHYIWRR